MRFPNIISRVEEGDSRLYELDISDDLIWFRGHFPGFPVLPGVVQLRWAVELSKENFGIQAGPHEVMRLKFKGIIVPPLTVSLNITRLGPAQTRFTYSGQGQEYSQGKLIFAENLQ